MSSTDILADVVNQSAQGATAIQSPLQTQPPPPLNPLPPEGAVALTADGGVYKLALQGACDESPSNELELITPNPGDQVMVHWVGQYYGGERNGEVFGSTRNTADGQGRPVSFKLDDGQSLRAIERCLLTMHRGESCRLFARADYAYGDAADDPECANAFATAHRVQPSASIVFDLALVDWQGEDLSDEKDGSLLRSRIRHGEGFVKATLASRATIQLSGRLADSGLEFLPRRQLEFELGDILAPVDGVCPGIEAALLRMFKGELARVWLAPHLGFGAAGCPELGVPPNARLVYELELLDFVKPKEVWQLSRLEKLQEAAAAKARGLECLAASNLVLAQLHCKRVVDYLEWDSDFRDDPEALAGRQSLLTAGRLNLALVCLKLEKYQLAIIQCNAILEYLDSRCEKALYRRGLARLHTCDYDQALTDFQACLAVNPANSAAKAGLEKCAAGARSVAERERRLFAGMFDRFAKRDAKSKRGGDYSAVDFPIDTWDNRLADGMLSIPQELEAFGEEMPQKKRGGAGGGGCGRGNGSSATIVEADNEK